MTSESSKPAAENTSSDANTIPADNRPAKRQKMDEAEVKKYETESAKLTKVEDYRERMKGIAPIKAELVIEVLGSFDILESIG